MGQVPDDLRNAVLQKFAGVKPSETETQPVQETIKESAEEKKLREKTEVTHKKEVAKLEAELQKLKEAGATQPNFSMTKPEAKDLGESALKQVMESREKQIASRFNVPSEKRKAFVENANTKLLKDMLGKLMP